MTGSDRSTAIPRARAPPPSPATLGCGPDLPSAPPKASPSQARGRSAASPDRPVDKNPAGTSAQFGTAGPDRSDAACAAAPDPAAPPPSSLRAAAGSPPAAAPTSPAAGPPPTASGRDAAAP